MFFGLCNAPTTFQAMMNNIFKDMIDKGWIVIYMDDILLFADNEWDLQQYTSWVVEWLAQHNLFLKAKKCQFAVPEVEFLGTIIHPGQVAMDPIKLKGIHDWPTPTTVQQVQSFLGFCNFYQQFIQDYSYIAWPLIKLTKKDRVFEWTSACQHAFN